MSFKLCVDAIQQNNFANFKKQVNSSALAAKDDQGQTLLHVACTEGRADVVSHILKKKKELIQELGILYLVRKNLFRQIRMGGQPHIVQQPLLIVLLI
jgi:ankyrin repeat protein